MSLQEKIRGLIYVLLGGIVVCVLDAIFIPEHGQAAVAAYSKLFAGIKEWFM
jgi:hypothetical protein